jgi:hypothetical protein
MYQNIFPLSVIQDCEMWMESIEFVQCDKYFQGEEPKELLLDTLGPLYSDVPATLRQNRLRVKELSVVKKKERPHKTLSEVLNECVYQDNIGLRVLVEYLQENPNVALIVLILGTIRKGPHNIKHVEHHVCEYQERPQVPPRGG